MPRSSSRREFLGQGSSMVVALAAAGIGVIGWGSPKGVGQSKLDELLDVRVPSPSDGDVLTWVTADRLWENKVPSGGPGADVKVKIDAADTTTDFLNPKLTVTPRLAKAIKNPGANEQLELDTDTSTRIRGIIYGITGTSEVVTRNAAGQITQITDDLATWTITYTSGFVSQIAKADGVRTETLAVTRDAQNRVTSIARTVA